MKFNDKLKKIGNWGFYGCNNLESITFPESLRSIGQFAFADCNRLKRLTVPAGVNTIGLRSLGYYTDLDDKDRVLEGFKMYCKKGTTAEDYAKEHDINYELIN